jgi:site-specific DNA-methyltransferase (cytosine-N4-specific)
VSEASFLWHSYRYFPYERELARREVEALTGGCVGEGNEGLSAVIQPEREHQLHRLTYFKGVRINDKLVVPDQARLEASVNLNGSAWRPDVEPTPTLRRQSTRYSAHGLHEYRGKFNPQVVRAVGNLLGLDVGSWVLDPFCGSGTTLLESTHIGWNCLGTDVNPLGVLIANSKVTAFKTSSATLTEETERLAEKLETGSREGIKKWQKYLPNAEYLGEWFSAPVLEKLALILSEIERVETIKLRCVFRVILSDICREVSLQDPDDLRIRRRKDPEDDYPVVALFVGSLRSKVSSVLRARAQLRPRLSRQAAHLADSRYDDVTKGFLAKEGAAAFDAAITSPPYATALPYIDTQRLSLCLLGLIRADEIRTAERSLIGNREISDAERRRLEGALVENAGGLPEQVHGFCNKLLRLAAHDGHGFRKRNVPALVFNYFTQMAEMFPAVRGQMKKGGRFALLVGSNKTTLSGEQIHIDTPSLLASVAESRGWAVDEMLAFETYQRFDIHRKNSIRAEELLILKNPG